MDKFHYNCPQGLMDGYRSIEIDQYCRWQCFKGYGACSSSYHKKVLDLKKITDKIEDIVSHNPQAKIFLDAPNFCEQDWQRKLPDKGIDQHDLLLQRIVKKKIQAYFRIETTVRSLMDRDDEYCELLAKAGVKEIWLGVESGDENLRGKYNKPAFTNNELLLLMLRLRTFGFKIGWYLVVGVEDSDESVSLTISTVRWMKPSRIFIFQLFGYEKGEQQVSLARLSRKIEDIDRWWGKLQKIACQLDKEFHGR